MDFSAIADVRSQVSYRPDFAWASGVGLISASMGCWQLAGDFDLRSALSCSVYAFCADGLSIICTFGYHSVWSLSGFTFAGCWQTQ